MGIKVRICKDCGTVYSEKTKRCETCGIRLGEPIDNDKAMDMSDDIMEENQRIKDIVSDRRNHGEAGGKFDLGIEIGPGRIIAGVIGILAVLTAVAAVVMCVIFQNKGMIEVTDVGDFMKISMCSIFLAAVVIFDSLAPNAAWALTLSWKSVQYDGILTPSEYAILARQIADYMLGLLSLGAAVLDVLLLLQQAGICNIF